MVTQPLLPPSVRVQLYRRDGCLRIYPLTPELDRYLRYYHRAPELVKNRRQMVSKLVLLVEPGQGDQAGTYFTYPGFFRKLVEILERAQIPYDVVDERTPMPPPDFARIARYLKLRDYQIEPMISLLHQGTHESGIISATGGFGKTFIQAALYAAWMELRTIVAIPKLEILRQTYKKYRELFPNVHIGMIGDGSRDESEQLTLVSYTSLGSCDLQKCQLLILDEVHEATRPGVQTAFKKCGAIRAFGFSATPDGLSNGADKVLTGMFGPTLVDFPYQDAVDAGGVVPVDVWMIEMPEYAKLRQYATHRGRMSYGIRLNATRNEIIARVASRIPKEWQAIIFVNEVEGHLIPLAKAIRKYDPTLEFGWIHRNTECEEEPDFALSTKQQKEAIRKFSSNETKQVVATNCISSGVDVPNCRVILQAAGGTSTQEVLQEAYRVSRIITPEVAQQYNLAPKRVGLIIDILDSHSETLENMSRKRMKLYESQGWRVKTVASPEEIPWGTYLTEQTGLPQENP